MRGCMLKAAVNGHLTDADCHAFLNSAPEDWPAKPLHSAGSSGGEGYCMYQSDNTRWKLHRAAAVYGTLMQAKNRDPATGRLRAHLVGLEGSHTSAGYKGSTRNFNPKFLRLEDGNRNNARHSCTEATRIHGHQLLPGTTLHQRIIVRSSACGMLHTRKTLDTVATGNNHAAVLARSCTHDN